MTSQDDEETLIDRPCASYGILAQALRRKARKAYNILNCWFCIRHTVSYINCGY